MHIYYVKARFRISGKEHSKQGYVLAEKIADAMTFAGDKIRTYDKTVDIHYMEAHRMEEQLKVVERAGKQAEDHWDKLYTLTTKKH